MEDKIYYRYEGSSSITLHELKAIKYTRCGIWFDYYGKKKFSLNAATKKFAYETKEEALKSFIARKEKQKAICKQELVNIEALLDALKDKKQLEYLDKYQHLIPNSDWPFEPLSFKE